jgi:hypothetical protein
MNDNPSVLVDNLCSWDLYFKRAAGNGDIKIPANAKNFPLLKYDEVLLQIQSRNIMFIGTDDENPGSHARIKILDDNLRKELFGIPDETAIAPVVLDVDAVKSLLAIKNKSKFNATLAELVKTDAEKKMVVELAKAAGGDEYEAWKTAAIANIAKGIAE